MNFPSIAKPIYPILPKDEDGLIRSPFENGVELTRNRFSRRRLGWRLVYVLNDTDYATFDTFYYTTAGCGALNFNWTHPVTSTVYDVRFDGPATITKENPTRWRVEFTIREV